MTQSLHETIEMALNRPHRVKKCIPVESRVNVSAIWRGIIAHDHNPHETKRKMARRYNKKQNRASEPQAAVIHTRQCAAAMPEHTGKRQALSPRVGNYPTQPRVKDGPPES